MDINQKVIQEGLKSESKFKRLRKLFKNKRGVTLIQVLFVIVILLILMVVFSDMALIRKVTHGNKTVGWTNDLTNLTNSILTEDLVDLTYKTKIEDGNTYVLTVQGPPVSAYDTVSSYKIDSLVTLQYNNLSQVIAPSGYTVETFHSEKGANASLPKISYSGSNGIAPFVNLAIPRVEESLFMGLLGGAKTKFGKEFEDKNSLDGVMSFNTSISPDGSQMKALLSIVFGSGDTKSLNETAPKSWVTMRLMDTTAMKDILGVPNRFLSEDEYRIYYVSSVATENEAIDIVRANYSGTLSSKDEDEFRKLYRNMTENILSDTLIIMPNSRNNIVYSEKSGFKYYKFSAKD